MQRSQMFYIRETEYSQLFTNLNSWEKQYTEIFGPLTLIPTQANKDSSDYKTSSDCRNM